MAFFSFFGRQKPILVQTGPGGRTRSHGLDKPAISIGRSPEADIVVDDPYLAPIHARIERQTDGTFVIRRMGLNPIVLAGEQVLQTASLKPGDSFRLGKDVDFQYVLKSPAEAPGKPSDGAGRTVSTTPAPSRPLLKRPAFLASVGLVYLALMGAVGWTLLSGGETADDGPTAHRIDAEASAIVDCVKSARRMRQLSEASFNGAVGGRTLASNAAGYAALAQSNDPADDAALAKAVEPIAAAYKNTGLAGLAAELRGNLPAARRLYQQSFDVVPDINCTAARFMMDRKAATQPAPAQ